MTKPRLKPWGKWDLTLWTSMDEPQTIEALDQLSTDRVSIENATLHAVSRARRLGVSWQAIANELNMSKQAAWEKWHHVEPS